MKKILLPKLIIACLLFLIPEAFQAQDYAWIKGSNSINQAGAYGTMGVADPSNRPGAREGAVTWKDASGDFWLFGGLGRDFIGNYGNLSDLWKYSVASNQWTFMKGDDLFSQPTAYSPPGVPTPTAKPGGRHSSVSWTDNTGNLWLLGGYGYDAGTSLGYINDLWKYNVSTNEWAFVTGGTVCYEPGEYGVQEVPAAGNTPGARMGSVGWTDLAGDLWLFGGYGNTTSSTSIGSINDVWRYNIANNEWTWMKGTNLEDEHGIYGTKGVSAPANNPGGRTSSVGWTDASGNFWLFGGDGWDAATPGATGELNDLWQYNQTTNEWTWIRGNNTSNQNGTYGVAGTSNPANDPGGRSGSIAWKDAAGTFWLFGGEGYPGTGVSTGGLNDLWKYSTSSNEWTWEKGSAIINQQGSYGNIGVAGITNTPGGRAKHAGWIDNDNDLYIFGGYGNPAGGPPGPLNDLWKYRNCFVNPITMTIVTNNSVICAGESTSLTVTGSDNYLWLNTMSTNDFIVITPAATTNYSVYTSDPKGCRYMATFTQNVSVCAGISEYTRSKFGHVLYPNPSHGEFNFSLSDVPDETQLVIYNTIGQKVFEEMIQTEKINIKTEFVRGVYYYQFKQHRDVIASGKLIIE